MGADVALVVFHKDRTIAEQALLAAFKALDGLEDVLSLYRPHSQICRLNGDVFLNHPHPDLVQVLQSAINWSRLTDGAFDPAVQPLWKLHAQDGVPDPDRLQAARQLVDWRTVAVDARRVRVGPTLDKSFASFVVFGRCLW
jgi:thiamine biosynthesis lipoprotein